MLGCGGALFVAPLTTTVMDSADTEHAGAASGIDNAVSRVAGLLAIAALGIVLSQVFYTAFDRATPGLALSPAATRTLARERAGLTTGKAPEGLSPHEHTEVLSALQTAYTQGFRRTMIISALLSWAAALVALFTLAPAPKERPAATPT